MKSKNNCQTTPPVEKLEAFKTYAEFLSYLEQRFDLKPGEHEALYSVLVKLQNVGADPLKAMDDCRQKMAKTDCLDMLRFMMHIENMDIADLKENA
jgi:hypothetical protein